MKIQQWLSKLLKKQNVTDGRTDRRTDRRTDARTDARTDNVKTVYPTTNKVCGGYNEQSTINGDKRNRENYMRGVR